MRLFFFNLTNAEAFLAGRERPRVKKVGPYMYHQEIHKVDVRKGSTPRIYTQLKYCSRSIVRRILNHVTQDIAF